MEEIRRKIKDKTNLKKLSIQVSLNGLSFCILNEESNTISFFKKIEFEKQLDPIKILSKIELAYEEEKALNQPIDEVKLIFSNSLFTLVPEELFDEDNASNYLKFNAKILKTDFVAFDRLENELVNIYIPYANITNYFFDKYGEFEYQHAMSILIGKLIKQKTSSQTKVFLNNRIGQYELIIIEKGKLLFANSFEYDTKEDFLYYLLFTAEQLELNTEEFELILLGAIDKNSEEYQITWNYIKNITFVGPFQSYTFETEKPGMDHSEYLLLNSF